MECHLNIYLNESDYDHLVDDFIGVSHAGRDSLSDLVQKSQGLG